MQDPTAYSCSDDGLWAGYASHVANKAEELGERLTTVMRWKGLTRSSWAKRADVSRNLINTFFSRLKAGEEPTIKAEYLQALAESVQINSGWLITGKGDPQPLPSMAGDDRYPSRELVVQAAGLEGVDAAIIKQLRRIRVDGGDPGPFYWYEELKTLIRRAELTQPALKTKPASKHS